jgi:hypothetical protein
MRRLVALFAIAAFGVLLAATAATAGRSDRDSGVRSTQVEICPTTTKPSDNPANGNAGATGQGANAPAGTPAGGTAGSGGNPGGTAIPGSPGGTANPGNPGGTANPASPGGTANPGSSAGGNGNADPGGNGTGNGGGNSGNGQGDGSGDAGCVSPPADPAPGAVAGDGTLPVAEAGKSVNVEAVDGVVSVKRPGADGFEPLDGSAQLPEGTVLDTRAGTVELTTADAKNGQQTAAFNGAKFEVRQEQAKTAVTELVMRGGDFAHCPRLDHGRRVQAIHNGYIAARGTSSRRLWGNGHGRFRTRGRWGSATVRGTIWQVEDRCDGTLTTVARGVVDVNDFGSGRTVSVKAGEQYFSRVRP